MKGDGEFELLFMVMGLLLSLFVLGGFVKEGLQPFQADAETSVSLLAKEINEVCQSGSAKSIEVSLPQSVADVDLGGVVIAKNVIPRGLLSSRGDPNILLYYESFPPGEAISWELYHDFGKRAVLYYQNPDADSVRDEQLSVLERNALERLQYSSAVFANVPLKDRQKGGFNLIGDFGKWNKEGNRYVFDNYESLSPLNKTAVKYRLCGVNALCLKTPKQIIVYPLDKCAEAGINYMQLTTYQPMFKGSTTVIGKAVPITISLFSWTRVVGKFLKIATAHTWKPIVRLFSSKKTASYLSMGIDLSKTTAGAALKTTLAAYVGGKADDVSSIFSAESNTDFYLASPCRASVKIEKTSCTCWDDFPDFPGFLPVDKTAFQTQKWQLEGSGDDYTANRAEDGFRCRQRMIRNSEKIDVEETDESKFEELNQKTPVIPSCIRVTVEDHIGFCFSKFKGVEGSSEFPLYQSASVLGGGLYQGIVTLESTDQFARPSGISTKLGAAGYSWP